MAGTLTAGLAVSVMGAGAAFAAPTTERISVNSAGQQGSSTSGSPAISADGRYVAFESIATNLGGGPGQQVYIRDRATRATALISVASNGAPAGPASSDPAISGDGRYVAFQSSAANLVSGDTNAASDIFVRDRVLNTTARVSVSSAGAQANAASFNPSISADGRYVAFESNASSLVSGDTNAVRDIFVRDRTAGLTVRVSVGNTGAQANAASANASITRAGTALKIAFQSEASNLVSGDTFGATDVFVRTLSGGTVRASVSSTGAEGNHFSINPVISGDGRFVAFESRASNLAGGDTNGRDDVFRHELATRRTINVVSGTSNAPGAGSSRGPSISADGRYVAFRSNAPNLVFVDGNGQAQDIFVADLTLAEGFQNTLASVSSGGAAANNLSAEAALSSDGRSVAFTSEATNLVAGDTNLVDDVFLRALQ